MPLWKRPTYPEYMQRTWWQTVTTQQTGLRVLLDEYREILLDLAGHFEWRHPADKIYSGHLKSKKLGRIMSKFSVSTSSSTNKGSTISGGIYNDDKGWASYLTHWGRVAHICVGNITIIGSENGLSPIWTSARVLLVGPSGTNYIEIIMEIHSRKCMWECRLQMTAISSRHQCVKGYRQILICCNSVIVIIWGPFYHNGLTLIPAWISNYIFFKLWDEIT